ncbi:hypothetical protein AOLI_G00105710 [Acnodon oligacanthus]
MCVLSWHLLFVLVLVLEGIKDSQPFSMVKEVGFKELVHILDLADVLPPRQTLKAVVDKQYEEAKEKLQSFDEVLGLSELRAKGCKMVTYFRTSTTAKETLTQVQKQMGRPVLKMTSEVDTRWKSTYNMLEHLYDLREPVGAALASPLRQRGRNSLFYTQTFQDTLAQDEWSLSYIPLHSRCH